MCVYTFENTVKYLLPITVYVICLQHKYYFNFVVFYITNFYCSKICYQKTSKNCFILFIKLYILFILYALIWLPNLIFLFDFVLYNFAYSVSCVLKLSLLFFFEITKNWDFNSKEFHYKTKTKRIMYQGIQKWTYKITILYILFFWRRLFQNNLTKGSHYKGVTYYQCLKIQLCV